MASSTAAGWSAYWRGAAAGDALTGGAKGAALDAFWETFFARFREARPRRVIDLCCGAGAVAQRAAKYANRHGLSFDILCADISADAARRAAQLAGDAAAVATDCAKLAFADGAADIALSQFGLEYAGDAAFAEAARIIAPGGSFAAIIHRKGGPIERECAENLRFVRAAKDTRLTETARAAFAAGYGADAGGSADAVRQAGRAFAASVEQAKAVMTASPPSEARAYFLRLFKDMGDMYRRRSAFDGGEVDSWLARADEELSAFDARMASMVDAAKDAAQIDAVSTELTRAGLATPPPQDLMMGSPEEPAAWIVTADKPPA